MKSENTVSALTLELLTPPRGRNQTATGGTKVMSDKPTYMDCWHFIAPLIPVSTDYSMDVYIMVFNALKEAEKKRIAENKKRRKATHEKVD